MSTNEESRYTLPIRSNLRSGTGTGAGHTIHAHVRSNQVLGRSGIRSQRLSVIQQFTNCCIHPGGDNAFSHATTVAVLKLDAHAKARSDTQSSSRPFEPSSGTELDNSRKRKKEGKGPRALLPMS
jgi:hypothetical protein